MKCPLSPSGLRCVYEGTIPHNVHQNGRSTWVGDDSPEFTDEEKPTKENPLTQSEPEAPTEKPPQETPLQAIMVEIENLKQRVTEIEYVISHIPFTPQDSEPHGSD